MGEGLRNIHRFHLTNENLGLFGNGDTCQFGNLYRTLTDDFGVQRTAHEDYCTEFILFFFI